MAIRLKMKTRQVIREIDGERPVELAVIGKNTPSAMLGMAEAAAIVRGYRLAGRWHKEADDEFVHGELISGGPERSGAS